MASGRTVIAVLECALDVGSRHVGILGRLFAAFALSGISERTVNAAETALALLFFRIIIYRLIVEHPVLAIAEKAEHSHRKQI